tara:strand:+ start:2445 stop:2738 length:294 start_codon:yes stop_codon:yes gene_type:complete
MSENENSDNNTFAIAGVIAVIALLVAFFTFSSRNANVADVATNVPDVSEKTIPVEEIVVVGERSKLDLVEKVNEAAIQAQVNEKMKNSEDTDLNDVK